MKTSLFFTLFLVFVLGNTSLKQIAQAEIKVKKAKQSDQKTDTEAKNKTEGGIKESPKKKNKEITKKDSSTQSQKKMNPKNNTQNEKLNPQNKAQQQTTQNNTQNEKLNPQNTKDKEPKEKSSQVSTQDSIEQTFQKFLNILKENPKESMEYKKAASFLEKTLYEEVSFDSLKLLADLYLQKEDLQSHLRIVKILSVSYPKEAESFYLLGNAHKTLAQSLDNEKDEEEIATHEKEMLESYRKALQLNPKHAPTYDRFLKELMDLDEESQTLKHTRESLNLVMDKLKHLNNTEDYILLCEAYYDTNFIRQTQKSCVKSIKKNPKDPISPMVLSFSLPNKKKREEKLIEIGSKYPNSFKAQYKIGLYFDKNNSPQKAITHFIRANKIKPEHLRLNEFLARLLLRNNREEEAYPYFFKTCLLTDGVFLSEFRNATGWLRNKKKIELALQYNKGVKECFQTLKNKKNKKKTSNS